MDMHLVLLAAFFRAVSAAGAHRSGRTDNIRRKTFLGGTASFVAGGSATAIAFRTVRVAVLDKIDKLKHLRGKADVDALMTKRVSTFGTDFKIFRFSKPTIEGESRIARHYARGSMARQLSFLRRVSSLLATKTCSDRHKDTGRQYKARFRMVLTM